MEIPDQYQFMDYGMDLYAPQTTLDIDGNRTMIAWVRMPEVTEEGWIGMFCSPRIVEMEEGHIFFRMHPNIRKRFNKKIQTVQQAENNEFLLELELNEGDILELGGMKIGRAKNKVFADRSDVFPNFEGAHLRSETPEIEGKCYLEILVDEHLVEVFINDGEYVITNTVYGLKKEIECNKEIPIILKTIEETV